MIIRFIVKMIYPEKGRNWFCRLLQFLPMRPGWNETKLVSLNY